jgi:hypothetical protein
MAGIIRCVHGGLPRGKAPLTVEPLARMVALCPAETLTGKRDRGLLLLAFVSAMRGSELAALHR